MAVIDIQRHHQLDHDHAIATADDLAKSLAQRFDVKYTWNGDILTFSRSGVKGRLEVKPHLIQVKVELGLLVRPFKPKIEKEIHKHLDGLLEDGEA